MERELLQLPGLKENEQVAVDSLLDYFRGNAGRLDYCPGDKKVHRARCGSTGVFRLISVLPHRALFVLRKNFPARAVLRAIGGGSSDWEWFGGGGGQIELPASAVCSTPTNGSYA